MIREKIKARLLKIREKQFLDRNGEFWPNMLNFGVMVLAAITTAMLVVFANIYLRSYPVYASFENIECSDAMHQPLSRGRYGSVQSFILSDGEEIKFRGSLGSGAAGVLYADRKFERDDNYHICFIRLQSFDLTFNNQLVAVWGRGNEKKDSLERDYYNNLIMKFNNHLEEYAWGKYLYMLICFMCVNLFLQGFVYVFFGVAIYKETGRDE
jgi:hypothetical protein